MCGCVVGVVGEWNEAGWGGVGWGGIGWSGCTEQSTIKDSAGSGMEPRSKLTVDSSTDTMRPILTMFFTCGRGRGRDRDREREPGTVNVSMTVNVEPGV